MAWKGAEAILLEPEVLSEGYLPERIKGREVHVNRLRSCLAPGLRYGKPFHAWLHGSPGSGKTAIAKFVARELHLRAKVGFIYVNCRKYGSLYSILEFILDQLRAGFGNHRDKRLKLESIERHIGNRPFIIILDEIDAIPSGVRNSLLYDLSFGKVGLLCISEKPEPLISLNGRAKSRLQPHLIEFEPYTPAEIEGILRERASLALAPESWKPEDLGKIANLAEGDVRAAIQALRAAAEFAEQSGSGVIGPDHIERAFSDSGNVKQTHVLERLGDHCTILYNLIQPVGDNGILSTDLWPLYQKECQAQAFEPVAKRTYSYYLQRMTQLKLIEAKRAQIRGHIFSYRVREGKGSMEGRTRVSL